MFTKGEYTTDNVTYGVMLRHTKKESEALLIMSGTVVSAYKVDATGSYSYNNNRAKDMVQTIITGTKGCTSKNGNAVPFVLGAMQQHEFTRAKVNYILQLFKGEVVGAYIQAENKKIELEYTDAIQFPEIPYVKLTTVSNKKDIEISDDELDSVPVRSVQEIALEKEDVSWLANKKYYVVDDDETAEQLFQYFEKYKGIIAYDTETTGLKINCFGKVGSHYEKELAEYNEAHPDDKIRADRLVGIIFCVEPDVSYYFPCFNRKFKNLYEDKNSAIRKRIIANIRARYTVGDRNDPTTDMYKYVHSTADDDFRLDVILMERVRDILEKCNLVAHNGTFESKVGYLFDIVTNITDDTLIIHQLLYKFRGTTRNSGSPSNLKYLSKHELGIDQWELKDFFVNYKEDKKGTVREKAGDKKITRIDFSYMTKEGTRVYAPTDGDCTLQLCFKYKKDLVQNHAELDYLYKVELIVSQAIAYMEFYGHRLDETKIQDAKTQTIANMRIIESEIRQAISYSSDNEIKLYTEIKELRDQINKEKDHDKVTNELSPRLMKLCDDIRADIDNNADHQLNLSAPGQVADLFFNKLGYPKPDDGKLSVAKKVIKSLIKEKNSDGTAKCPVAKMYSDYKNQETLLSKFFDNLIYFMYPGGYIFSSYGQIATATGRMSCIEENQYVTTVGGSKKIKDVKPGDLVYCYDDNGKIKISKVLNVIDKGIKDCVKLNWVSKGSGKTGSLICTPDHKIKVRDRGWVQACNIEAGDRAYHITRSNEDRPRIYGAYGFCEQEQILIKKEYFNVDDTDIVVHHIDENTRNNDVSNLTIMSREEHSSLHGTELANLGRIRTDHLYQYTDIRSRGVDHPRYIEKTYDELKQMLIDANGILTKVGMDFSTYKKKCNEVGFDYLALMKQLRPEYADVDIDKFMQAFVDHNGTIFAIANELGIGRTRVQNIIEELGLDNVECSVSKEDYIDVFKESEGDCKKISEKLNMTIRQVQTLNRKYNLTNTSIADDDFIDTFNNCKGSIRAVARHYGITFYKASKNAKRLGLAYNHTFTSIENVGKKHVYDIEIEDYHNFIANEICVHNCNKPNAQQYPKVITKIVIPRDGYVMADADYSQIEYRVLTALAKNEGLAKLFADPDSDYHTLMASMMYGVDYAAVTPQMRSAAKSFNFGIPYGMGDRSLSILLTGKTDKASIEETKEKKKQYFANQPKTEKFFENIKEMAQIYGYTKTAFNRYRYYTFVDKDGNVNNAKKAQALRQAGNAVIQGCLYGGTLIQTKEYGIVKIKNVVNQHLTVWDGEKWVPGDVLYSGKKKKCIINFANGQKFICSPTHKFLVLKDNNTEEFVECKDLVANSSKVILSKKYMDSDSKCNGYEDGAGHKTGVLLGRYFYRKALANIDVISKYEDTLLLDSDVLKGFIEGLIDESSGFLDVTAEDMILDFGGIKVIRKHSSLIQRALAILGIKSVISDNKLIIKATDFAKLSIDYKSNNESVVCTLDINNITMTDEQIDMFDVCNTDGGYYVADGIITHNTAADIFKISVARNFSWIKRNNLLGKVLIINMVHDEQLMEYDAQHLNVQKVLAEVGKNMQFDLPGFPPLYIGAGIGKAWGYAKGKMAEIHPLLLQQLTDEAENMPLFREDQSTPVDVHEVLDYFDNRVYEFRRQKVVDYLIDKENWGKDLHPAIGGLINLQFNYGRGDDAKAYTGPNGEKYSDKDFLFLNLADFIKENGLDVKNGVSVNFFKANEISQDVEEDVSYDDSDDPDNIEEPDDFAEEDPESQYKKIDESGKLFGSSVHDLINIFGACLLDNQKVCGIKVKDLYWKKKEALLDYLIKYYSGSSDDDEKPSGYEVVFLTDGNVLQHTGVWINNLNQDELEKQYKLIVSGKKVQINTDYSEGDIDNRSQAK